MSFGTNFRRLREARGINRSVLVQELGVSMATISMWESDRHRPAHKRINQICEILGVSVGELMSEEEPTALEEVLARSREQIARLLGISPGKVKIMVEL